ncbi:tudor domain-containing protein 1 [Genypterus blacodes]|uniref:tudor domain-containing protein 1 n=1 Tax=Genypterus blacodes TaxID=154954 RepID=UPI003F75E8B8
MKRSFAVPPALLLPTHPLRRPSSIPSGVPTASIPPNHGTSLGPKPEQAEPSAGDEGHFQCERCRKTTYCSVVCQTEDWKAHRHMCSSTDPDPVIEKPKKTIASPIMGGGASPTDCKNGDASGLQKVYLDHLPMAEIRKGPDMQALVIEFHSPSRFFILAQSPEIIETLQNISVELQKTFAGCAPAPPYVPCLGEVCAVQFSSDRKWYRGLVQTVAPSQDRANILYIDFGNEEDVPVDRINPLAANIPLVAPCAMECRVAGVVPVSDSWSGPCCTAVRQMVVGKSLTVSVVGVAGNGHIYAVDVALSSGKQLSTLLIEQGYGAEEEEVNTTPTDKDISAMFSASLEICERFSDGTDENTWALPPTTQAVGDSFSAVVTHLQSPDEMFVQKWENAGATQELQLRLREHCREIPASKTFRPAPGTTCCAQFSEDNQWYRAKVLLYPSEERVCVVYFDFGNSEDVPTGGLRPISAALLAVPMQAVPCALAGVLPIGESWSEECVLALSHRVSNTILRIDIQGTYEGKALVTMMDEASDPQADVAQLLLSAGYAAPATNGTIQQADGTSGSSLAPQTTAEAREPLRWSNTELPCDGQTVALLASVLENPGDFYCCINNPTDLQQLRDLGAELKQHCEADAPSFTPKVGEPCCAMFPADGAWYRAMVKGLHEHEVAVDFVDYGYNIQVEKSGLRPITPQLLTLPFQAVRCCLAGVDALGSQFSSETRSLFRTLVAGERLSARVLSVEEGGYAVQLESRGLNVAAALVDEHRAKDLRGMEPRHAAVPKDTPPAAKHGDAKEKEHEHSHTQLPVVHRTGASSKDVPTEKLNVSVPSAEASFPVNWKTVELQVNDTFQPLIAAAVCPSLLYLFSPNQVDAEKLRAVMTELATHCSTSSPVLSTPVPGAACCARFSADNTWYRAVVLEASHGDIGVIYADYGNTETLPLSRILPIPPHLLQLPFQIARCALAGKERFPAVWPVEVLRMFQAVLLNGVIATVRSFDGSANLLSLSLPSELGGGHLTTMMLDALHVQSKTRPGPAADRTGGSTSITRAESAPEPKSIITEPELNNNMSADSVHEDPVQKMIDQTVAPCRIRGKTDGPQTSGCCCVSLETKIDHLEQLLQLQLSLIKQLVQPTL